MKLKKTVLRRRLDFTGFSYAAFLILAAASWFFILKGEDADAAAFFSSKNMEYTKKFLNRLFDITGEGAAFKDPIKWKNALKLTYDTLHMSILATFFSVVSMIAVVIPAARNAADGTLTLSKRWYSRGLFLIIRSLYIFSRAVPELIWAMIVIFIFKPGIFPGAIALFLHNFGILGKLCTEVVEDLDLRPIRNLSSSGANTGQLLIYGVVPMVIPKFITFILYRWEVIIRTTIVVGFVGAGGLGQQFKLSMSWFKYTEITQLLVCYLLLVVMADLLCSGVRRMIR